MLSTKQLVYQELSSNLNSGFFISGQELAEKCHVSRTAIWKAIQSLLKDGLEIEAVTNRGYRLLGSSSAYSEETLKVLSLDSGVHFKVFSIIDSSNSEAKRLCAQTNTFRNVDLSLTKDGEKLHKLAIVAEQQTAGRGRIGRPFYSPATSGVYLSLIYIPKNAIIKPAAMTAAAAVIVCRALKKLYNLDAKIKWVNDIFVQGRKVCGILTEGITNFETGKIEAAIVGIGINVCDAAAGFPKDVSNVAGSLLGTTNSPLLRNELVAEITTNLAKTYDDQDMNPNSEYFLDIMKEYKERSILLGKQLTISPVIGSEQTYTATAIDITLEADLIVEKTDGTRVSIQSGEVTLSSTNFVQ